MAHCQSGFCQSAVLPGAHQFEKVTFRFIQSGNPEEGRIDKARRVQPEAGYRIIVNDVFVIALQDTT